MSSALQKTNPQIPPVAALVPKKKALEVMASSLNVDPLKLLETLKATVFQKASDEELLALVVVANTYGLNPLLNEMFAFPKRGGGIVPIVGVDGWNKMMQRQDSFDGIEFEWAESSPDPENGKSLPISCTAIVYVKGRSHPVRVTEYYDECYRPSEPWKQMPRRMLRHKALIQAARLAFGFSGLYDEDEGAQAAINVETTVTSTVATPKFLTASTASTAKPAPVVEIKTVAEQGVQQSPPEEADQRTPYEKIKDFCKRDSVSDDQVLAFAKENKLAGQKCEQTDDMSEANATKIVETWANILPSIREIQI